MNERYLENCLLLARNDSRLLGLCTVNKQGQGQRKGCIVLEVYLGVRKNKETQGGRDAEWTSMCLEHLNQV